MLKKNNSSAENHSLANADKADKFAIKLSEVAIAASFIVAGLFLIGFSYINVYLTSFGLSALEINTTYYATAAHGFNVLLETISNTAFLSESTFRAATSVTFMLIIFQILSMLLFSSARYLGHQIGLYGAVLFLLFATCSIAVAIGTTYGHKKVEKLVHAPDKLDKLEGVIVYCKLKDNPEIDEDFKNAFEEKSDMGELRKIIETRDLVYFTYLIDKNSIRSDLKGHAIAIQKSNIEFCRFINYERYDIAN